MRKYILMLFVFLIGLFVMSFTTTVNAQGELGINLDDDCKTGVGRGCFNVDKLLFQNDENKVNERRNVMLLVSDVVYGAMVMVGTILTLVIIYCGLMYIFAARGGNDVTKYRKGLLDAAVGALLVWGAYAIVRLIQYMARF